MEISIESDNDDIESNNSEQELQNFKRRWSMRNANSVQEITLQHMET